MRNKEKSRNVGFPEFRGSEFPSDKRGVDIIDLLSIVSVFFKKIVIITLIFTLIGCGIALFTSKHWLNSAIISPATDSQLQPLEEIERSLSLLNINLDITSYDIISEFRKYYSSQNVLMEYSSNVKNNNPGSMNITLLVPDQNAKNYSDNRGNYILTYNSSLDSGMRGILAGYIDYVNKKVNADVNNKIKFIIDTAKITATEEYRLALQQAQNEQKVRIQRLAYAASIAKAAGLYKPVNDVFGVSENNSSYPISLGYDGLNRQLEIEQSITDLTTVNADLLNKKFLLDKIMALKPVTVNISAFNYLQQPSEPIEQGAKKRLLVVLLFGFIGLFGSIGFALVRHYVRERQKVLLDFTEK